MSNRSAALIFEDLSNLQNSQTAFATMSTDTAPTRNDSTTIVPSGPPTLVIAMVGLPARGKSYISKKLLRYFNWFCIGTRIFNAGDYRRQITDVHESGSAEFYNPDNEQGKAIREQCAAAALQDLCNWLQSGQGQVAIFDATNTTKARRAMLYKTIVEENKFGLFFIESICNDQEQIQKNIVEAKAKNDDYKDGRLTKEQIIASFNGRISNYLKVYEELDSIDEGHLSYFKIIDGWKNVEINKTNGGPIMERIVKFLHAIHIAKRSIFLVPCGYEQMVSSYLHDKENENIQTLPTPDISPNSTRHEMISILDELILSIEKERENVLVVTNSTVLPILLEYLIGGEQSKELLPDKMIRLIPEEDAYKVKQFSLDFAIRSE